MSVTIKINAHFTHVLNSITKFYLSYRILFYICYMSSVFQSPWKQIFKPSESVEQAAGCPMRTCVVGHPKHQVHKGPSAGSLPRKRQDTCECWVLPTLQTLYLGEKHMMSIWASCQHQHRRTPTQLFGARGELRHWQAEPATSHKRGTTRRQGSGQGSGMQAGGGEWPHQPAMA